MQYAIIAHDGKDLENIAQIKGKVICAGGILDEEGKMAGSVMILDFESKDLLDEYLKSEPYIQEHVWDTVEVEQMNVVIVNGEKTGK